MTIPELLQDVDSRYRVVGGGSRWRAFEAETGQLVRLDVLDVDGDDRLLARVKLATCPWSSRELLQLNAGLRSGAICEERGERYVRELRALRDVSRAALDLLVSELVDAAVRVSAHRTSPIDALAHWAT